MEAESTKRKPQAFFWGVLGAQDGVRGAADASAASASCHYQILATAICLLGNVGGHFLTHGMDRPEAGRLSFILAFAAGLLVTGNDVVRTLRRRGIDVNLLMILAGSAAGVLGYWNEAALLMFLFSLSTVLERLAVGRTRKSLEGLMSLKADRVRVVEDRTVRWLPIAEARPGMRIRIAPGERIALDGRVRRGTASIDASAMTGESIPISAGPGDRVWAGTLNLDSEIDIEVSAPEDATKLARIIRLVEEARESRGSSQRIANLFGNRYAIAIIALSFVLACIPSLFLGLPWKDSIYRSLTVLVVASPCALVLATPAVVLSAIASAARAGILIKGGAPLETLARVRSLALDKTGTLTAGQPRIMEIASLAGAGEDELIRLAASAEKDLSHPIARALTLAARQRGIELTTAGDVRVNSGVGVVARIDGAEVCVGKIEAPPLSDCDLGKAGRAAAERMKNQGWTCFGVAREGRLLGLVAMADMPRIESAPALDELKRAGIIHTVMLTGDYRKVAESIASEIGVDSFLAELMPEDKCGAIRRLSREMGPTAMVGDGINDAPALSAADVSVAMGGIGSDAALESADIVLMTDDLGRLPMLVRHARRSASILRQNFSIAIGTMSVLVVLAIFGLVPLPMAVIGHEGTTVLVMLNGLRLLKPLSEAD